MSLTPPTLHRADSATDVAEVSSQRIVAVARQAVQKRGLFTLALSGGSTPKLLYERLASLPRQSGIPWRQTHIFFSDERCVPPSSPESNCHMASEALLSRIAIPEDNVHRMRGEMSPPEAAALYEEELRSVFGSSQLPRFDVLLLGLGEDGHTASLFPGVSLSADDQHLVAAVFVSKLSTWRLTFTPRVINAAAHVIFLVTGTAKRAPLQTLLTPIQKVIIPAQLVQPGNGTVEVFADRDAAS
ncbi:MAG: 6-phosphogluconolactonase [Chloroflexi bacterium]|nr:6-phosphogluconolactonase [Chloroflexota bacterium]